MGNSSSPNRRRNNHYLQNPHPYMYASQPPPPPPPPNPHPPYYQTHNHYYYGSTSAYGAANCNYASSYYANQSNGCLVARPPLVATPPPQAAQSSCAPPYVDHQSAKKVKNDVNVHKDTIKLEVDEENPDCHLVSFVFDALFDGSITILYFGKELDKCAFVPLFPEAHSAVTIPFVKGPGQRFRQPCGTGIDLGFFELDDLSKPSPSEDVFPLVISAETSVPTQSTDENLDDLPSHTSPHMQITEAVLEKNHDGPFQVRVVRQILWVEGVRYELREIYGIGNSAAEGFDDDDPGKECVICMTDPKDTAVLPCRHMCMCSGCAQELRLQSNKCPICRQPIEELIEIKISNDDISETLL